MVREVLLLLAMVLLGSLLLGTVVADGPPGPPENLTAEIGDMWVLFTWDPPLNDGGSNVTNYNIEIGISVDNMEPKIFLGNVTSFNHTGLRSGVTWYIGVLAINTIGRGNLSEIIDITLYQPPGRPADALARGELGQVSLSWSPPDDNGGSEVLGYNISRGPDRNSLEDLASPGPGQRSFVDTDIVNGTEYYYEISAYNEHGTGGTVRLHATPYGAPLPPEITVARTLSDGWELKWEMPENDGGSPIVYYYFYETTDPDHFPRPETIFDQVPFVGYSHIGLRAGRVYYVRMAWGNMYGTSEVTETFVFNVTSVPERPYNLNAAIRKKGVDLVWAAPDDGGLAITGYQVFRTPEDGVWEMVAELGPSNTTYTDTGVKREGDYSYRVRAVNEKGVSEDSEETLVHWKAPDEGGNGLGSPGTGLLVATAAMMVAFIVAAKERDRFGP